MEEADKRHELVNLVLLFKGLHGGLGSLAADDVLVDHRLLPSLHGTVIAGLILAKHIEASAVLLAHGDGLEKAESDEQAGGEDRAPPREARVDVDVLE